MAVPRTYGQRIMMAINMEVAISQSWRIAPYFRRVKGCVRESYTLTMTSKYPVVAASVAAETGRPCGPRLAQSPLPRPRNRACLHVSAVSLQHLQAPLCSSGSSCSRQMTKRSARCRRPCAHRTRRGPQPRTARTWRHTLPLRGHTPSWHTWRFWWTTIARAAQACAYPRRVPVFGTRRHAGRARAGARALPQAHSTWLWRCWYLRSACSASWGCMDCDAARGVLDGVSRAVSCGERRCALVMFGRAFCREVGRVLR
ncbi:hypothetical protein B0H21DRAFT_747301 [Amylocystis lapponica]|nr:hypothetical protein B0H21DRAFT_747301 [Amylocystis lapponica]